MRIIAKECPKCGSNLQFKVGDREAHCKACRRDFVIEYDHDKTNLSPEDFQLAPNQKALMLFVRIVAISIFIISALIMVFMLIAHHKLVEGLDDSFENSQTFIEEPLER